MAHPIRCRRKGFETTVTDGAQTVLVRAESAPEARRFAEAFTWIMNIHPEWTLGEVLHTAHTQHQSALYAQAKRRFASCFARHRRTAA